MHRQAYEWISRKSKEIPHPPVAIDIGGRSVNGNPRELFPATRWTVLDARAGDDVDIVADFLGWDAVGKKWPLVTCFETLEHVTEHADFVYALCRLVAPGGWLLITAATHPRKPHLSTGGAWRDVPGEVYRNVDPEDLLHCVLDHVDVLKQFELTKDPHGDVYLAAMRHA